MRFLVNSRADHSEDWSAVVVKDPASSMRQVPTGWHPQYGIHVGWPGLMLLVAIAGMGSVAFLSQLNLLFWGTSLAVACLVVSIILPGRMVNAIEITKALADTAVVGEPMTVKYEVRNSRRWFGAYSVRIVELLGADATSAGPRAYIPYIGAGGRVTFQVLITPRQRGQLVFRGSRVASRYPFGVLTRFRTIADGRGVTVYPALGRLDRRFVPGQRGVQSHLRQTQSHARGDSDEFYALREYRRGDNPHHIYWKRSAKMGQLVVREMSRFAPHRLTVILNTHLPNGDRDDLDRFEEAVSFVATLMCDSLEKGYRVTLVCTSDPPVIVPPLSGREAQHRILRTLSQVQGQAATPLSELVRQWRWTHRWRGQCLLVGLSDPGGGVMERLSDAVGPVHSAVAGTSGWRRIFVPSTVGSAEEVRT